MGYHPADFGHWLIRGLVGVVSVRDQFMNDGRDLNRQDFTNLLGAIEKLRAIYNTQSSVNQIQE